LVFGQHGHHKREVSLVEVGVGLVLAVVIVRRSERRGRKTRKQMDAKRAHLWDRMLNGYAHGMTWRLSAWVLTELAARFGLSSLIQDAIGQVIG
jgi:hypothetical protein